MMTFKLSLMGKLCPYIILFIMIPTQFFAQVSNKPEMPVKGKLVDIGGYKLHINEQGNGSPVVVLIAGSLAFSFDWYFVQKEVKNFSKVISYDRPGFAWSDAGPSPRTMKQDVYELHQLLLKS